MPAPYIGQQTTGKYSPLKCDYTRLRYRDCRNRKQCVTCRQPVVDVNPRTKRPYLFCPVHRERIALALRKKSKARWQRTLAKRRARQETAA